MADRTGEIGFINVKYVEQMQLPRDVKESVEFEEQPYYRTLYGHQECCLGLKFSSSGKRIVSWDTLKKVVVTNWPNVFNIESQLLEHTEAISLVVPLKDDSFASLSG